MLSPIHPAFKKSFLHASTVMTKAFMEALSAEQKNRGVISGSAARTPSAQEHDEKAKQSSTVEPSTYENKIGGSVLAEQSPVGAGFFNTSTFLKACLWWWCLSLGCFQSDLFCALVTMCLDAAESNNPCVPRQFLNLLSRRQTVLHVARLSSTPRGLTSPVGPAKLSSIECRTNVGSTILEADNAAAPSLEEHVVWGHDEDASDDEDGGRDLHLMVQSGPALAQTNAVPTVPGPADPQSLEPSGAGGRLAPDLDLYDTHRGGVDDILVDMMAGVESLHSCLQGLVSSASDNPAAWRRLTWFSAPWDALPKPYDGLPKLWRLIVVCAVAPGQISAALRWYSGTPLAEARSGPNVALQAMQLSPADPVLLHSPASERVHIPSFVRVLAMMDALGTGGIQNSSLGSLIAMLGDKQHRLPNQATTVFCDGTSGQQLGSSVIEAAKAGAWVVLLNVQLSAAALPALLRQIRCLRQSGECGAGFRLICHCRSDCLTICQTFLQQLNIVSATNAEAMHARALQVRPI
jgi:hypothetical protein